MDGAIAVGKDVFVNPGDLIAGKYEIVRIIGQGGMGVVVEAMHVALKHRVAIKFLRPESMEQSEAVDRFLREAKAAAQIKNEHVARVTDVATLDSGAPYFVMELLDGRGLDTQIDNDGPLPLQVAIDYTLQVCEALAEAHAAGIVHRDLKPGNLFLAHRSDGSIVVKLLDFGISKVMPTNGIDELSMTRTRAVLGSPLYMAPEQMRSTRRVDQRADIWSLGVLLHEMLTGETPFLGDTLPEVCASIAADEPLRLTERRPDAPPELEDVILRCLEKDPEHRFANVAEFAESIAKFAGLESLPSVARIGRLLHGVYTPSLPPVSRRSLPQGSLPPPDQRLSGIAPKLKHRVAAQRAQGVDAMIATQTAMHPPVRPWWRTPRSLATMAAVLGGAVGGALLLSLNGPPPPARASTLATAPIAPSGMTPGTPPPAIHPPAPLPLASPAPPALELEILDSPQLSRSSPPSSQAAFSSSGSSGGAKASLRLPSKAASSASSGETATAPRPGATGSSTPEPVGTAAFGASRD
jgi:serine/threonine protein kinase